MNILGRSDICRTNRPMILTYVQYIIAIDLEMISPLMCIPIMLRINLEQSSFEHEELSFVLKRNDFNKRGVERLHFQKKKKKKKAKVLYLSPRLEPLDSELCCQHTALYYASICPFGSIGKTRILIQSSDLLTNIPSAKWVGNWKKVLESILR